jgi:glycosyltransferase involved in cell wall biosynthesis
MLARRNEETTLADRAFSSVPEDWNRLLVLDEEPDEAWRILVRKHRIQIEIMTFLNFAAAKNIGLDLIKTEWVFVLDSDEELTQALVSEIELTIRGAPMNGYYVSRQNKVFGVFIRYGGWYPDYQLKLFRPSIGRYVGEVHEHIMTDDQIGYLANDLQHDTVRSMTQWLDKTDRYTDFEADILAKEGKRITVPYLIGTTAWNFLICYIRLQGYRDGMLGLIIAGMSSYYRFLSCIKLWEREYANPYSFQKQLN